MASVTPAGIELDGKFYPILDRQDLEESLPYSWRPFHEKWEPIVIQEPSIAGESRKAKSPRPDILEWVMDDWSLGEGQQFIDADDPDSFRKYYYSLGAVDVRNPGEVTLGYKATLSSNLGGTSRSQGPYLVHRGGGAVGTREEAYVDDRAYSNTTAALDTWTDRAQSAATAGNRIAGPARVLGGYVFLAMKDGSGAAGTSRVRRGDASFTFATFWAATETNRENALPADNRLYCFNDNSGVLQVRRSPLTGTLPLTPALVYAVDNVGFEAGVDNLGSNIYILSQYSDGEEEPRVHQYDGTQGYERVRLPVGFRMDATPYDAAVVLGDILFCAGYLQGDTSAANLAMITYVSGARSGTVGIIREGTPDSFFGRAISLHPGVRNQLLIGTDYGKAFVYDIAGGGISELFSGVGSTEQIISIDYYRGVYYFGVRTTASGTSGTVKVYRTALSGTDRYPARSDIAGSTWDFTYPNVSKLIHEVEVVTRPLPADCTVKVELEIDGSTVITTDVDGNTLTHSGTGTRKTVFKISGITTGGSSVSRHARTLKVNIILEGPGSSTPTVRHVAVRALAKQFVRFTECTVKLQDDGPGERMMGAAGVTTGYQKAEFLRALWNQAEPGPVMFRPRYRSGDGYRMPDQERPAQHVVVEDLEIILTRKGAGYARLLLRRID